MSQYNKSTRGKLFKYFKQKLDIKISTKGWYRSDCPHCGGNYCFAVHLIKNKGRCFKCNEEHTLIETLQLMENFETINQVRTYLNIQQEYEGYEDAVIKPKYERKRVELPISFRLLIRKEGIMGKAASSYMKGRGFDPLTLSTMGVGYCLEGDYAGYIIFPFYRKGELVFYQGRRFFGGGPKMRNPTNEDFGVGKTELIFNQDALFMYNRINIVESITNALTLGDNTIAILGKVISPYQLYQIVRSPITHVTILLDDDAYDKAIELALKLVNFKKVRLVVMPPKKDVNDLGKTATKKMMEQCQYHSHNYFYKLKLNAQKQKSTEPAHNGRQISRSLSRGF